MASSISYQSGHAVYGVKHFLCDTLDDVNALPVNIQPGSTAYCIANSTDYILGHDAQWHKKIVNGETSISTIKAGGAWDENTEYAAMTTVSYKGNVYITIKDTPAGILPTNTSCYTLFLEGIPDGSDKTYIFLQTTESNVWTIEHNMNKYPSVTIIGEFDEGYESVLGDIEYIDENTLTVSFETATKGKAYLN